MECSNVTLTVFFWTAGLTLEEVRNDAKKSLSQQTFCMAMAMDNLLVKSMVIPKDFLEKLTLDQRTIQD